MACKACQADTCDRPAGPSGFSVAKDDLADYAEREVQALRAENARLRRNLYALATLWRTSVPLADSATLLEQANAEGQEERAALCAQALIAALEPCDNTSSQPDGCCSKCGVPLPWSRDWIGSTGQAPMCQPGNGECERRAAEKEGQ